MKDNFFLAFFYLVGIAFPTPMMSQISPQDYQDACVFDEYLWDLPDFREGIACVEKNGKWGYIDKQGKEVIPFIFGYAYPFSEGMARVKKDGKWGYIDKQGKEVIPFIFGYANSFSEGIARVKKDGKWGYIDKQGREITPFIYEDGHDFSEGMAHVEKDGKWGYIDKQGHEITPFIYEDGHDFSEGMARVSKNGKWGYIDKQGHEITTFIYDDVDDFSEGIARVKVRKVIGKTIGFFGLLVDDFDEKYGYIDKQGRELIPCNYFKAYSFSEGMALVMSIRGWGYIDKQGKEVIPFTFEDAYSFTKGIARVKKDGKWGYIDKQGHEILPFIYEDANSFSEGMAHVEKDGKWGYIDKQGHEITPFIYEDANSFSEGIARVKKDGKWGYIDKQGREITPFIFDRSFYFYDGMASIDINKKTGFIDKEGKPLIIDFSGKTCYENGVYEENRISQNDSEEVKYNNYKKALSWFMKGAVKENLECCYKVGFYNYNGFGVDKNYAETVNWLEKSNQLYEKSNQLKDTNGNTYRFLGYCYSEGGYGITKDESKAFSYFMEGAKYNNEGCNYALAICYLTGQGCAVDLSKATSIAENLYQKDKNNYSYIYSVCYNALGYDFASKKDYTNALAAIDKAIASSQDAHNRANFYDSKGEIYLMMGKEDEAIKIWNKVMELDKDNLKYYEENSELYKQLKAKGKI